MPYLVGIYVLILVIVAVDIAVSDGRFVRGVPKIVWLLGSMALPLLGPIAWLALGRPPSDEPPSDRSPSDEPRSRRGGVVKARPSDVDTEERAAEAAYRRQVRQRAEEQRRIARGQQEPGA